MTGPVCRPVLLMSIVCEFRVIACVLMVQPWSFYVLSWMCCWFNPGGGKQCTIRGSLHRQPGKRLPTCNIEISFTSVLVKDSPVNIGPVFSEGSVYLNESLL